MSWNDGLTDEQREAVGISQDHAVLLAGPGTGKTYVLVRRVEYLIEHERVPPNRIVALTFTRAAAAEMRQRLEERLGDDGRKVRVSTLHSYALKELLRQGAAGLPTPVRIVGDWEERWVVVEELARSLGRTVDQVRDAITRLSDDWDTLAADGEGWADGYADPQFLEAWRRHREVYGYTLRSELVYQLLCELRENPRFSPAAPYEVILVDEYQDLNLCDLTTIKALSERADARVYAAGDDDQSIYSFRHAHPAGIRMYQATYPGASTPKLTQCLRCGQAIVDLAKWLIEQELGRIPKDLVSVTEWGADVHLVRYRDQNHEAQGAAAIAASEISRGVAPEEVLILLRSDRHDRITRALSEALGRHGIAVYLPRASQSEDLSLQILIEYLILAEAIATKARVDDLAVRSLLELEDNGVGRHRLLQLLDYCIASGKRFWDALDHLRLKPDDAPIHGLDGVLAAADAIVQTATDFAPNGGETFEDWLTRICTRIGITGESLQTILAVGAQVATEIETAMQGGDQEPSFTQELSAAMSKVADTLPPRIADHVTITTMHGAKGLSADVVLVLQTEDEVMPGDATGIELDEARRLLYVSLTRARRKLIIGACERRIGPQRFVGSREAAKRNLTRFLRDFGLRAVLPETYIRDARTP